MIKTIKLKFGRGFGSASEEIATTPVTVFVGPNNSGKSKALAEINYYCSTGQRNTTDVILDSIEFDTFPTEIAEEKIKKVTLQPHLNEALLPDYIIVGKRGTRN
jgi:predicted ATPase